MFGKKKVPDELPTLAVDEMMSNSLNINPQSFSLQAKQEQDSFYKPLPIEPRMNHTQAPAQPQPQPQIQNANHQAPGSMHEHHTHIIQSLTPHQTPPMQQVHNTNPNANKLNQNSPDDEQGYFKELIKSVTEETENLEKLDSWYKNKFLPGDMVFQMREYWEKQQPDILFKNVSGELKQRLIERTDKLHTLEKEWQDIYFTLLSKEEQIRKEEKELKDSLSEFIEMYKNSTKKK